MHVHDFQSDQVLFLIKMLKAVLRELDGFVDSKACLTAVLWCCGFVRLWLCSRGPVAMLSLFLPWNLSLSVSSILLSFWAPDRYSVFLNYCNHTGYSPTSAL